MSQTTTDQAPELTGKLSGTRRTFIKGVAAAGAATAVERSGVVQLFGEDALAGANDPTPFADFKAIAANTADRFEVPAGFRADVLIRYADQFSDGTTTWTYGYNCDFLAFFPLDGRADEGLIFVNHEYPDPFFQHGYKTTGVDNAKRTKSRNEVYEEMASVGNSIVHIRRNADGVWGVVSPSPFNRRIFGGDVPGLPDTPLTFTGPLAPGGSAPDPKIGAVAKGTVGNCSGGITPWGTALSCEENYDGYGNTFFDSRFDFNYGWDHVGAAVGDDVQQDGQAKVGSPEYVATTNGGDESRRYGWVCEHDPYDPEGTGRKHTALGRFRHENTAFNQRAGGRFVLYMGDDASNQGVYKFVSSRAFVDGDDAGNRQILSDGKLYVAKWAPEGRRRFASANDLEPVTAEAGTGEWVEVDVSDLYDTRLRLAGFNTPSGRRAKQGTAAGDADPASANFAGRYNRDVLVGGTNVNEWDRFFATNRPEDVEVDPSDSSVYIAFTNNSSVNDTHGSVRRVVESGADPEAMTFTWEDFATGGPDFDPDRTPGERGFSSPDNLVFDKGGNVWVVTDISSGSLNKSNQYTYHGNNAVFMIPESGDVAYRFANMPTEAEGTGPYFTPDEQTLFINVQHPGEETKGLDESVFGQPGTYTSYWPRASKTDAGATSYEPLPSTVAITRVQKPDPKVEDKKDDTTTVPPKSGDPGPPLGTPPLVLPPAAPRDRTRPRFKLEEVDSVESLKALLGKSGWTCRIDVSEPARMTLLLQVTLPKRRRRRRKGAKGAQADAARSSRTITLARLTRQFPRAGAYTVKVKPSAAKRATLRRLSRVSATLTVTLRDGAGNTARQSRRLSFRR